MPRKLSLEWVQSQIVTHCEKPSKFADRAEGPILGGASACLCKPFKINTSLRQGNRPPGECYNFGMHPRVDDEIFDNQHGLFEEKITATAYIHGELAATAERVVRGLQQF